MWSIPRRSVSRPHVTRRIDPCRGYRPDANDLDRAVHPRRASRGWVPSGRECVAGPDRLDNTCGPNPSWICESLFEVDRTATGYTAPRRLRWSRSVVILLGRLDRVAPGAALLRPPRGPGGRSRPDGRRPGTSPSSAIARLRWSPNRWGSTSTDPRRDRLGSHSISARHRQHEHRHHLVGRPGHWRSANSASTSRR